MPVSKQPQTPRTRRYVPTVGPWLQKLLTVVFALFAVLVVNSVYLIAIRLAGEITGAAYENYFYLWMFLIHIVLGIVIVGPVVVFGVLHWRNSRHRPNRRAVRAGYALFTTAMILLVTGFMLLTRADGAFVEALPGVRPIAYWLHVVTPLVAMWLFVLHRLAGRRIKWKRGLAWTGVAAGFALIMLAVQAQDPRQWNVIGNEKGEEYFFPALSRTVTGDFIPKRTLMNDQYCLECHADVHEQWSHSMHKFSSFNNPAYAFSVRQTRQAVFERDGNVHASRFCAGCHDPVPLFTGEFDHPRFDDPEYDLASDQLANAGITCTVCHAITNINSVKGNGDYTIEEPIHYPFTYSESPFLQWVNRQLVKSKPAFHKKTFLKPLHQSPQFCGSCHKVHLPEEFNGYKWLRGQNHYDAYWLSGVSGNGVTSFYYPKVAEVNCNGCHMPLVASHDFGADFFETDPESPMLGELAVHDHQFPSANTAIPYLLDMPANVNEKHREFLEGVMRVDIFGVREEGSIDGKLIAPIDSRPPALAAGKTYLLETVIRTLKMGHMFTQGTADSNEIWMDVTVSAGDRVIGRSGAMPEPDNEVDPWAHFVNAFVIDRKGNRIDRRNPEDIFIALYSNQIPPGAADTVHYLLEVPPDISGPVTVAASLKYRKFDTTYMRHFQGEEFDGNDLPIVTLATHEVTFAVNDSDGDPANAEVTTLVEDSFPLWQRWNDYGIGLLRQGLLRQAREAFERVEKLGRPDGPINLARVYIREGLIQTDAPAALARADEFTPPARPWSLLWFGAQVDKRNGAYAEAENKLREIVTGGFPAAAGRKFDFSNDYRLLNELADTIYQQSLRLEDARREKRLHEAARWYKSALELDPENLAAHYGLKQIYVALGERESAKHHGELHAKYKPDDNARDAAVAAARRKYPAANHAAEQVVIYDLQRSLQNKRTVAHP